MQLVAMFGVIGGLASALYFYDAPSRKRLAQRDFPEDIKQADLARDLEKPAQLRNGPRNERVEYWFLIDWNELMKDFKI